MKLNDQNSWGKLSTGIRTDNLWEKEFSACWIFSRKHNRMLTVMEWKRSVQNCYCFFNELFMIFKFTLVYSHALFLSTENTR